VVNERKDDDDDEKKGDDDESISKPSTGSRCQVPWGSDLVKLIQIGTSGQSGPTVQVSGGLCDCECDGIAKAFHDVATAIASSAFKSMCV
jgi:hypothetical protein